MKRSIPAILSILFLLSFVGSNYRKQTPKSDFDFDTFGRTPIVLNGRIQPLDSVARNSLLVMNGKRTAKYEDGTRHTAIEWLAELMFDPVNAAERPVFRIYDDGLRSLLPPKKEKEDDRSPIAALLFGKGSDQFYYSFMEIRPFYDKIRQDAVEASQVDAQVRTRYQNAVIELANNMIKFHSLSSSIHHGETPSMQEELLMLEKLLPQGLQAFRDREAGNEFDEQALAQMMTFGAIYQRLESDSLFFTHPQEPGPDGELHWEKASFVLNEISNGGAPGPISQQYAKIVDAYRNDDAATFNKAVVDLHSAIATISPDAFGKTKAEQQFNFLEPFYVSMVGYVMVLLLAIISWIRWHEALGRAAFLTALVTLLIHSAGIAYRIHIIGYAPVINLYSSAIFVGWGAVFLALILEKLFKNSIGNFVAAMVGFSTLIVAHHLGDDGDTLEMMRAVLDSNFWLSTHVIIITLGYASTFLSGALAIVFVVLGLTTKLLDKKASKNLQGMVYGIVCFSTLFSFVGTILGGIWADQSWGRFWGWDPKENGAILLVLWNVIILHARWGGFIKARGLMAMAIFGNIVTSWSWMGTNMLGIGLHSYGFMNEAFLYLVGFVVSQLVFIGLCLIPAKAWASPIKA